jgi:UDP-glucose 4-epimerase
VSGRAVVLGAGGFLGSHLTRRLITDGWDVVAVVADHEDPQTRTRLAGVLHDVRVVQGDAFDDEVLAAVLPGAEAVFPFASHSGAARSLTAPLDDVHSNAVGQLVVLEGLRRWNLEARTVFPGSRLQYGRAQSLPVTEEHLQEPTSLYGLHKMLGERYHLLYHHLYGQPTSVLRISNPYGPHQDRPDRAFGVVGTFLATASAGQTITLYGGGTQLREYVYVDDLVELIVLAATQPAAIGQVFNASGPRPTTLRQMADTVISTVGRGSTVEARWPPVDAAVETGDYVGDWRKADRMLGWSPTTELSAGLATTWEALAPQLSSAP